MIACVTSASCPISRVDRSSPSTHMPPRLPSTFTLLRKMSTTAQPIALAKCVVALYLPVSHRAGDLVPQACLIISADVSPVLPSYLPIRLPRPSRSLIDLAPRLHIQSDLWIALSAGTSLRTLLLPRRRRTTTTRTSTRSRSPMSSRIEQPEAPSPTASWSEHPRMERLPMMLERTSPGELESPERSREGRGLRMRGTESACTIASTRELIRYYVLIYLYQALHPHLVDRHRWSPQAGRQDLPCESSL